MASSSTQRAHGVQPRVPAPWVFAVVREFEVTPSLLQDATNLFVQQLREGLAQDGSSLLQVPSYVTKLPDGSEKGTCLAIDLGGTNLRVCSVELRGDSMYSVAKTKAAIPVSLMAAQSYKDLFRFVAEHVEEFLLGGQPDGVEDWHWPERIQEWRNLLEAQDVTGEFAREHAHPLGFTFSFTFDQHAIDRGTLLHWTKAFTIKDAVGRDPCAMLQEALDEQRLPLVVTALVNDTVGTLAARAYSAGSLGTLLGAIFGTGTNGAYMERLESITKLHSQDQFADPEQRRGQFQALNTEWGGFDGKLEVLPVTPYDAALDRESANPDDQHFEKRISGMYLGEILRLVLVERCGPGGGLEGLRVPPTSRLFVPNSIDSSFLSALVSDRTAGLDSARGEIQSALSVSDVTVADAEPIRAVAEAIGRRAARLSAIAVAGIVIQSGRANQGNQAAASAAWGILTSFGLFRAAFLGIVRRFAFWMGFAPAGSPAVPPPSLSARDNGFSQEDSTESSTIDIGVDGSLFEHFPGFEDNMRAALREIPAIGLGVEQKIRMGTAKDGSSVGAALIAWTVGKSRCS
ncbi:hypothetical protein MAPG_04322 [Magnaporthiopsis poae ATCC 64411]|uniref:Phosphotransferase n=1 Tax=Magnaporthiopsis poae (strain ATCC 64411 / 73-15) TaxID=644358 RepID=A0A0C4DWE6_MAGP6|nr:hypothetical protein MAPG_04322 [Magnaporthiopsis poae ATCC 64411]